ncbi:hypothetical protein CONPUDRAFT_76060 [Coniophora puteana RWD-64-598 SS2]|uniref:Uncharacterized protein n=1 Tax=Coniophora puteana (strain RWD-64-598) TaxID=741705 RepID=A0A5M3MDG9_CONPW|nr:uncharacterized protein CONPUDRAFT_76060 [Coniophora puteana RWD-64-598 SS2]EIW77299.1 hypothetical protein CONPUDRAFT_76060 [Coniophora puteana RWD-64-598 SS2]
MTFSSDSPSLKPVVVEYQGLNYLAMLMFTVLIYDYGQSTYAALTWVVMPFNLVLNLDQEVLLIWVRDWFSSTSNVQYKISPMTYCYFLFMWPPSFCQMKRKCAHGYVIFGHDSELPDVKPIGAVLLNISLAIIGSLPPDAYDYQEGRLLGTRECVSSASNKSSWIFYILASGSILVHMRENGATSSPPELMKVIKMLIGQGLMYFVLQGTLVTFTQITQDIHRSGSVHDKFLTKVHYYCKEHKDDYEVAWRSY